MKTITYLLYELGWYVTVHEEINILPVVKDVGVFRLDFFELS